MVGLPDAFFGPDPLGERLTLMWHNHFATSAAKLLESGRLAIVQGVSYPNPSRSHFKSMAIWHSANVNLPKEDVVDAESQAVFGWIGQALDEDRKPTDGAPSAQFVGGGSMPVALIDLTNSSAAGQRCRVTLFR